MTPSEANNRMEISSILANPMEHPKSFSAVVSKTCSSASEVLPNHLVQAKSPNGLVNVQSTGLATTGPNALQLKSQAAPSSALWKASSFFIGEDIIPEYFMGCSKKTVNQVAITYERLVTIFSQYMSDGLLLAPSGNVAEAPRRDAGVCDFA